jgi:dTDP-4-dehydrorhamnose reductase
MKKKIVIILGSKGMLGQMVQRYFGPENYEVIALNDRFTEDKFTPYINKINSFESGIVINCIGKIKQKSNDTLDLLWSNTVLPLELSRSLDNKHFLVQPSTDCVFNGQSSIPYPQSHQNDAQDIYGWSKSLGETAISGRKNSLIVRVSIIGPDNNSDKGLLSWFLNLPDGSKVNGFTNHFWNGITTLEWCKQVESLLSKIDFNQEQESELVQLGTRQLYSKYEMLKVFQHEFGTKIEITPFNSGGNINRCLEPKIFSPTLEDQIIELKRFMG